MGFPIQASFLAPSLQISPTNLKSSYSKVIQSRSNVSCSVVKNEKSFAKLSHESSTSTALSQFSLPKCCMPIAACVVLFWSNPAQAGFLSGSRGLESVPGPELPRIEFLEKINEENQKRYAANDERIKQSPIMKEFLERSQKNKEKNKQAILDKYCLRGAEWGVGDCSTTGMTPQERDEFIAMLRKKVGDNQ